MKIGILTYHWATNYGAVMQCYALQTYLESQGHMVNIINYKPLINDDSLYSFFKFKKYVHLRTYCKRFLTNMRMEYVLKSFRKSKLKCTKRLFSYTEIPQILADYDVLISGSDQVLNPTFLMHGEGENIVTPTYFLGFPFKGKRIGYALSFGCVSYPQKELTIASKYINCFDYISVREKTGMGILEAMGRLDATVVPDPTLLMNQNFYHQLSEEGPLNLEKPYVYSFFIRNISERKNVIGQRLNGSTVIWNNDDGNYTIQNWLFKIRHAELVITDSFHCMVMCLKMHKSFVVVTEQKGVTDMNDRFYTLLEKMSLGNAIMHKSDLKKLVDVNAIFFDWERVDKVLEDYRMIGEGFLKKALL